MKSSFRLQSETITSASRSAHADAFRWVFNMQSRFSDVCSVLLAAPLLSQDRWDGFNLIIAADVASEYFLKHLLSHEKLSEQSFFQHRPISHFAAQSFSARRRVSVPKCSTQWDFTRRSVKFQIHFLGYT